MPSAQELFGRLGPRGVQQLQELFDAGGYTEDEREEYIQKMSQGIYQQEGRGPIPSSTPPFAPSGQSGPSQGPPSPISGPSTAPQQAPQQAPSQGFDWRNALMALGGGLQGMSYGNPRGGGGGGAGVLQQIMAGRQEEEQQKRRVADQLRLVQERGKLSQQQAGAKQAQEAQSKQQEAEAYIGALEGSLNAETHPAVRQRVEAGIQMLRKGGDPKVVEKLVPWLDPPKVDIRQHEGVYEPIDPYTGKPTQPARALKGPQAPKTSIEAGRQIDTPGQAPYAGLVSEFPAQQAPSVTELPETAKEKQLREEKMTEEERRYQRNLEDRREDRQQAVLDRRATIAAGAAAGREARAEAKSNEPVGKDAALWMKRDGTGPVDPRTPMREVMEIAVPVTQSGVNAAASAKTALETLQEYRSLVKKLLPKSTGDSAKDLYAVQGNRAKLFLLEKAGNPDARRFSALKGTLATQARATGDTANIAVKERELLESFMATTGDTQESAEAVLNQAERILRSVAEGRGVPTKPPAVTAPGEDKEKQKKSGKGWREK